MTDLDTPKMRRPRLRPSRRAVATGVTIGVLAVTATAIATTSIQNNAKSTVAKSAACVTKVAGTTATAYSNPAETPYLAINTTATAATATAGVNLLNEALTARVFAGDIVTASDSARVTNTCNYPLTVKLRAEASPFSPGPVTSGDWTDTAVKVYLGKKTAGASGTNFTVAADWDQTPISITASATGTVANAVTGTVTLAAGASAQIGVYVDAGTSASTSTASNLNFTVEAIG